MKSIKNNLSLFLTLAFLTGCTTVGHPYPFPNDSEPSAALQIEGKAVYLLTLNEKGCYTGKTYVDGSPGAMPVKVVPDKPLVISYEENVCMLPASFTPQKDGRYRLVAWEGHKPSDPDMSFFQSMMRVHDRQCIVGVMEISPAGEPVKAVKVTELRPRQTALTCIKFR
ncbi:hypothetical protein [Paraburkholderia nodosa]|uniref:hypothetical protein n=1 Tax=Paraburkholderia nodosa TaxID=392320 RepID=UPI0008419950|nr:hypothetical protein [Paraburkholderia nodosa]